MVAGATNPRLGKTFQALLAATAVTNLGDGIRLAALPLLATALTDSKILIAGVTAAQFLPWLVFGPIGGVIVDRADRRRLILATQAWRALVMIALAAAVVADVASIWMVFAVAFVITVGEILVDPSVVAVVPTVVGADDLDHANGRISSVELVTNELVGGPIGALLFAAVAWVPFAADGLSYLGSTLAFRKLPRQPRPERRRGPGLRSALDEVPEGIRWLWAHPMLRPWTLAVAVFNVGGAVAFSLLVLLVIDVHGGTAIAFGVTLAVAAIAGAAASAIAPRLVDRHGRRMVVLGAAVVEAIALLAVAAAPSLEIAVVCWSVSAGSSGVLLAIGRGFIQRHCPNELLGRAAIGSRTITRTAFVVGAAVAGVVGELAGVRAAYVVAGVTQTLALPPMARALRADRG